MINMHPGGISLQARKLPLIILADTSGSMTGAKIASMNQALQDLAQELRSDQMTAETVLVSLITFNNQVHEVCILQPIRNVNIPTLTASGATAMGAAIRVALAHLSDRTRLPISCTTPTIALCSDGRPTDQWRQPLEELKRHPLASRAARVALAIGEDADASILAEFIGNPEFPVLRADEADKIQSFFQWVTLHTKSRSVGSQGIPQPSDLLP